MDAVAVLNKTITLYTLVVPQSCLSLVPEHWACLSQSYILASHWSRRIEGRVGVEVVTTGQVSLNVPTKNQIRHKALGIFKLQPQ